MRPVQLAYDSKNEFLYASTNRGTILKFDKNLHQIDSSSPVYNLYSLYTFIQDETYLYGRDITGKLARWRKDTLELEQIVDLTFWSDPDTADAPNVSHGLFIYKGHVYVSMPRGNIGVFKQSDLEFVRFSSYIPNALFESVSTDVDDDHFAVDFSGYLYRGHVDHELIPIARVAHGACHQILFDRRHRRYWVTDDIHCGVAIFSACAPSQFHRLFFTRDDVEWMSFSPDSSQILVACFDRYIYRIRNTENPEVIERIGPLKYQCTQVVWPEVGRAYVVTEAGEVYGLDLDKKSWIQSKTGTNSVWDIKLAAGSDSSYWVAFEDGYLRKVGVHGNEIQVRQEKNTGLGMIRRLSARPEGGVYALATRGDVVAYDENLRPIWVYKGSSLARDLDQDATRILTCSESGELVCLDRFSGALLWKKLFAKPLWAVAIQPGQDRFLVSERLCQRADQGEESSGLPAQLMYGDLGQGSILRTIDIGGNIKKISWVKPENFLINGNGEVGTSLYHLQDFKCLRRWSEWQLNTCEATVLTNDKLFTTTYGYQLNTYSRDGETLESSFPFEDYATSLVAVNESKLLAGGRGAFLALFALKNGVPALIRTQRFK